MHSIIQCVCVCAKEKKKRIYLLAQAHKMHNLKTNHDDDDERRKK